MLSLMAESFPLMLWVGWYASGLLLCDKLPQSLVVLSSNPPITLHDLRFGRWGAELCSLWHRSSECSAGRWLGRSSQGSTFHLWSGWKPGLSWDS